MTVVLFTCWFSHIWCSAAGFVESGLLWWKGLWSSYNRCRPQHLSISVCRERERAEVRIENRQKIGKEMKKWVKEWDWARKSERKVITVIMTINLPLKHPNNMLLLCLNVCWYGQKKKVKCQVVCASVRNPCRVSPLLNAALALVSAVSPQDWIRCTLMFSDSRSLLQPRLSTVCVWADHWNTRVGSCHKNMKEVVRFQEEDSLDMLG